MRYGVISDTHDNIANIEKAIKIFKSKNIDTVIHLGDIIAPFSLAKFLRSNFRVIAVYGNNDGEKMGLHTLASSAGSSIYEQPHTLNSGGRRILLIHGLGDPDTTRSFINHLARSGAYDIVLYGHTHSIDVRRIDDTLVVNPGEACGYLTGKATLGILDIESMDIEIIEI